MVNICESLINVVKCNDPKLLNGSSEKARAGQFNQQLDCTDTNAHGEKVGPTSVVLNQPNKVSPISRLYHDTGRPTARNADEDAGT
jgi:hypothetical protein